MKTFYAIKKNQTHTYDRDGKRLFVTILDAGALTVTQIKTQDKDKYQALQIGVGSKKNITKPLAKHLEKANIKPLFLREIKLEQESDKQIGTQIKISEVLQAGDLVDIRAKNKGRGFAGAMKRWNFGGGPKTHGQSDRQRAVGSIGQGTTPGLVRKGKKMPGRMGGKYLTIRGSQVVYVSDETNELWVTGSVPGHKGTLARLNKVGESKFVGLINNQAKTTEDSSSEEQN